ncbi:hypothetical protein [Shimia thalassica]|uniref:hypothetical protein n=1 Tax=Shimia thalassica TaxID=1715693 RepID=UPI002735C9D0|nr:hypothetical protein [Shimia thalassica]MDP2517058.1 hypothetical protein [Shimia thalassica]
MRKNSFDYSDHIDTPIPKSAAAGIAIAASYAAVASAIFGGLTLLSEHKQEDRLEGITAKLDEIKSDIWQIRGEIIDKIEEVALREIASNAIALVEKLEELPLDTSGTALTLILNGSAELKQQVIQALTSSSISDVLKVQYAAILSFVIANRMLAMGAIDLPADKLFVHIESESLDLEYYKPLLTKLFVDAEVDFLSETNFMFSSVKHYPDSVPEGPYIATSVAIALYISVSEYDKRRLRALTQHLPVAGTEIPTGVIYGGFPRTHLKRRILSAWYDREKIVRRALDRSINHFINVYGQDNWDFRWDLSAAAGKPFQYWIFPKNSSPYLANSSTSDD